MNFLFVHQNFPGQFRHVARALADNPEHRVVGVGDQANLQGRPQLHPGIQTLGYKLQRRLSQHTHHYLRDYEGHVHRGQMTARLLLRLKEQGFVPDVIFAHPGWGEALFLKDVFPSARQIQYFEYYYQATGGDVGFDPEFPAVLDDRLRIRIKNSTQLQSLVACDQGISPTNWQKSRYPEVFQSKIEVIHEGADTDLVKPDAGAWIEIGDQRLHAGDEIVTCVARNLEPYRGFHTLIRMLPRLQALRPNANVLVVGGEGVSYGKNLPAGQTYRQRYCAEVADQVDWSRVHFLGKLPYADYLKVLQVSAAHIYLTYPFVLSWSMLEAMAAQALLIASATSPVEEVISHGKNGLLVDFFDHQRLAETVADVLSAPGDYQALREAARATIVERYDLKRICLPRLLDVVTGPNLSGIN